MPKISSPKDLEEWLEGKPADWARAIAARTALRVFPVVFLVTDLPNDRLDRAQKVGLIL